MQVSQPHVTWWDSSTLFLDVAFNRPRTDFGAVNDSLRVGGNTFGGAGAGELGTYARFRVGDKSDQAAVLGAADSNAAFSSIVIPRYGSRLRIGNIEDVFFIDV